MSKLTFYILIQLITTAVIATLSLCLLITMVQSAKFIDLILNNGLPLGQFIQISLLAIPRFLVLLIPIVLFGATLFTYNRLVGESEIVVMRAAGMSQGRLANAGLLAALIGITIGYSLTLYLAPATQHDLRQLVVQARSQWGTTLLSEGKFTTIDKNVTLFFDARGADNSLLGIFYYNLKEKSTVIAERGLFIDADEGTKLVVINGSKQIEDNGQLRVVTFERSTVDIGVQRKEEVRWIQPEERFITNLFWPDESASDQAYFDNLIVEGHNRMIAPLLSLALPILAMAVILKGGYSRRGNLKQILAAILIMIAVYIAHLWLLSATPENMKLLPLFYANVLVPGAVGLFIILKPKYLRRKGRRLPENQAIGVNQ